MNREQIEREIKAEATRDSALANIKKAGLPMPPKPPDAVAGVNLFTEWETMKRKYGGIANVPFNELGDFLDRWTTMVAYARWCEALADIDQATAREIRDTIKKQLYTIQDGNRELRDAMVYTEPMYKEWQTRYEDTLSTYILMQGLREGYEQRANAISREITRRGNDVVDTRRAVNRGNNT